MASKDGNMSLEEAKKRNEQIQEYKQLQQLITGAEQKLVELKNQSSEHQRVLDTLSGVPEDRKAFRLIGGVLVERTVAEVKPAVEANRVQIEEVVKKLTADLDAKRSRFVSLQTTLGVQQQQQQQQQQQAQAQASQGVLV